MDMDPKNNGSVVQDKKGEAQFVVLDWQDLTVGSGHLDLTNFMTFSCNEKFRV